MTANTPQRVDVERLRELLAKATPGPWGVATGKNISVGPCHGQRVALCNYDNGPTEKANAALIAEGINALPALLQKLADAKEQRENLNRIIRQQGAAIEAAERAMDEARELLGACRVLMQRHSIDYRDIAWPVGDSLSYRIAAFLAANGGRDETK